MASGSRAEMGDPEALRTFISTLQGFNSELQGSARNLTGAWGGLQQVWRDPQCDRFAGEWESTHQIVERYLAESAEYVSHLQTKLRQVEEFGR